VATLNLGILAHVDAGKTTLTERLLFAAGVIDDIGRVDHGTTQTDSLALERQRGITIKSAVVSFMVDDVIVNLIDTPGHPDFIAEVERVLEVLDGAVLVISAVEGVQSQTLVLHRALCRLGIPTVIFVNKIDRAGAEERRVLDAIGERLAVKAAAMNATRDVGTRGASVLAWTPNDANRVEVLTETLAINDDQILHRYLDGERMTRGRLHAALAAQTAARLVYPVYFGSAMTGAGTDELMTGVVGLLPPAAADATGPPSGTVFKIGRGPSGEKVALIRMFAGTLTTRDRIQLGGDDSDPDRVTAIRVFSHGRTSPRRSTFAGEIADVRGLTSARIGDRFGAAGAHAPHHAFPPPTLETAVVPRDARDRPALFAALSDLAEQDPLINLRQDDTRGELFLSLYGEVQREIVAQTLANEHGIDVAFRSVTPICIERPGRAGSAIERIPRHRSPDRPFLATVGLTIAPLPPDSGVTFALDVKVGSIPMHVFGTIDAFRAVMARTVKEALGQGLHGWTVTDCAVTMTDSDYQAPPRKWPGTTLSDYRLLTPLVVMDALQRAGTTVCEPVLEINLEFPADVLGPIMATLIDADAVPGSPNISRRVCTLAGEIRAARLHDLQSRLPDLTRGEGVLESTFGGYRPVTGEPPSRPRTDHNPLDRADYLRRLKGVTIGDPSRPRE
jgi:ribosomal protection tetracycline resistance protein